MTYEMNKENRKKLPLISVIIPAYNTEKYLAECIDSVLNQTYKNFEVICIDDGSTDGTLKILEQYALKDKQIKVISQQNQGLSITRNIGLDLAKGKYIYFLDSDDMIIPETFEEIIPIMEKYNLDSFHFDIKVFFDTKKCEDKYSNWNPTKQTSFSYVQEGAELFRSFLECKGIWVMAGSQINKKDFLIKNNLLWYPKIIHEDELFTVIALLCAKRTYHINKQYYLYRKRDNSITTSEMTFHNIYSYLTIYIQLMNYVVMHPINKIVEEAVVKRLETMKNYWFTKWWELSSEEKSKITSLSPLESHIFKTLVDESIGEKLIDINSLISLMKSDKYYGCYLYTSGNITQKIYDSLIEHRLEDKLLGFVDGRKEKWGKNFLGKSVVSYDSCKTDFNVLFIIGLSFLAPKNLLESGVNEYVIVTDLNG